MSLEETATVDAIGIENDTLDAVLTIADSWDWTNEHKHLSALQAKLNAYFEFVESGQIWDSYPAAQGRQLRIDIIFRFPPPSIAQEFLAKASNAASELDVFVTHRVGFGKEFGCGVDSGRGGFGDSVSDSGSVDSGRVAPGDCSPAAPTDPDVQVSRIRFLK